MRKIKIMADSTCDLSRELLERYDIAIVPLYIVMDGVEYKDGIEVTPEELYQWSDRTKQIPKTAAVGLDVAADIMKKFDQENTDILVFGISEEMSSTCNVFQMVSQEMEQASVYVINSRNLSTGIGLQILRAAEWAKEGMNAEEIVKRIYADREKVRASFVIDTLVYLQRGGRCNAVTALLAGTLKLKPQIGVVDGKMGVVKKFRGNTRTVILKYVESLEEDLRQADEKRVFITHSGVSETIVREVYDYLQKLQHFDEILITRAGSVISSHCGPNTLGVLFYEKDT